MIALKTPEAQSEYGIAEEESSDEPNFIGKSLRDAMLMAQLNGWQIVPKGSGYVKKQTVKKSADALVYELTLTSLGGDRP
jgi:hypothetical protein